ncbi:hypothetical protein ABPG74_022493 [Tetrahymena malaccensis]
MSSETVKVMVRARPMNKLEISKGCANIVQVDTQTNQIILSNGKESEAAKVFTYDYVFPPDIQQQTVYENSAFPLVESVVEGYNGTIFAYGQTGCGKTHSMLGKPNDEVEKGIIPRTFSHIINIVESANDKNFLVRCSYIEIYNEEIHDLLGKDAKARMDLKEYPDKGVFVKDLTMNVVKTVAEMEKWMNIGTENRSVGATAMNKDSSRSHSIFTLYIECSYKVEGDTEDHITAGKLNLVDLAGSERQSKTQATGDRLKEATKINLSLSALGNVISALVDGKSQHVPYRDSKLTRLLQDSLGGNTKTIMIAAISPADYNYEETLSTLRYASRAKNIKNQPKVNQDPKDALLKEYADEIKKLKEMLLKQQAGEQVNFNAIGNGNGQKQQPQLAIQHSSSQVMNQSEVKKLKEKNDALNAERQQIEEEMKNKEKLIQQQLQEKLMIEQKLKEVEQKFIVGGTADQDKKKKISQMRNKLKKQMQEHEKIQEEMKQKEEEFENLEIKYSSLQEELDATKKKVKKLSQKYKQAQSEIKDLEKEHEIQKEDLLDTIRYQQREVKILMSICQMLLTPDEIEIIKGQGEWQDDYQVYKLPPFYFKQKKLNFPKLPAAQAIDMIDQEKQSREIDFMRQNNNFDNRQNSNHQNGNSHSHSNSIKRIPSGTMDNFEEMNKFQFGNGPAKSNNTSRYNNGFQNGNDDYDLQRYDAGGGNSLHSIQESHKEKNNSPNIRIKKAHKVQQQPEKQRIPNVSLDPIESQRIQQQKLMGLQDSHFLEPSFQGGGEQRRSKNIQLQPIQARPLSNSQTVMNLNQLNKNNINMNSIDFDQIANKTPNRVKLDKIQVPR